MSDKRWLTVAEVASVKWLDCSERYVLDELRRNNLRGIKLTAGWRVEPRDIETYMSAKANVRPVRGRA